MNETTATFAELTASGVISVTDGYRAKNSELGGDGLIFLRAGHVTDAHIDFTGVERFHENLTPRLQHKTSCVGDVIVTTKGNSTGRTSFVDVTMPTFVYSPHLSRWRVEDRTKIDPAYLRYWSRSPQFVNQMRGLSASTDMAPYLSLRDQQRLEITLPHIDAQRGIGEVLSCPDDKIEQNRRTGAKLEGLARGVFKAWFVDFEPVKAKSAGATTFPGMPPETFAVLPNAFQGSPLGPVPQGWEVTRWGEIASLEYGKSLKGYQAGAGRFQVFGTNGPIGWHTAQLADGPGIVIGRKGAYRGVHYSPGPFWAIDTAFYLKPKRPFSWKWAYYELLRLDINGMDSGSAIPSTSREDFYSLPVCLPRRAMFQGIDAVFAPIFEMLVALNAESAKLATLRDYLLPRLLSGRVRVNAVSCSPEKMEVL